MRILVVEDDQLLNKTLSYNLSAVGYSVDGAMSKAVAIRFLEKQDYDLIVLDVNLPDGNGFDICREVKERRPDTAVIFLTANDMESDMLKGFELGADDYVTKPFSPKEVAYRVKAQLRRTEYRQLPSKTQLIKVGALSIDPEGCHVTKDGKGIELTAREFEILHYMAQNIGRVISKERLYETVWGEDGFGCDNTIMVHIRHLREKIESNPTSPEYIITMKGLGYKLVNPYEK